MKKFQKGKRAIALSLCAAMMVGVVPFTSFATNTEDTAVETNPIISSVKYLTMDRTQAEITYNVPVEPQDPVNVIFLVDASKTGEPSKNAVVQMLVGNGSGIDLMYKYGTQNIANIISYAEDTQESGFIRSKEELEKYSSIPGMGGDADEKVALKKAAEVVEQAHELNDNPTVVVWAMGSKFNKETEVEQELTALTQTLGEEDALVTYQLGETPSEVLKQYATKYTPAGKEEEVPAAYAQTEFYAYELQNTLESLVQDDYANINFTLRLAENQTMVQSIGSVSAKALTSERYYTIEAEKLENDKGVQVTVERIGSGNTLQISLTVDLDPNVQGPETVIEKQEIVLENGMYTGLFDEKAGDKILHFPKVELNRGERTISYKLEEDGTVSGSAPAMQAVTPGKTVTIAPADGISKTGYTFGGWVVAEGEHAGERYAPNAEISMPDYDLVLKPAWGYVGVEVEVGQAEAPVTHNQIMELPGQRQALDFSQITVNGKRIGNTVRTITFLDESLNYVADPTPTDPNKVIVKDKPDVVYARNIAAEGGSVIAYVVPSKIPGYYDMYISGKGGVKAAFRSVGLFAAFDPVSKKYLANGWNQSLKSVDFNGQFDTSTAKELALLFYNCSSLTEVKGIEKLDVSNVERIQSLFYGCTSLEQMDLSAWDTSNVTNASFLFAKCTSLEDVKLRWDATKTKNLVTIQQMFRECASLVSMKDSGVEDWVLPNVTEAGNMFYRCTGLQTIDLSKWMPDRIVNLTGFFQGCRSLESFSMKGWNVPTLRYLAGTFIDCTSLKEVDLSSWTNINSLYSLYETFLRCSNLETIKIPNVKTGYKEMLLWVTFRDTNKLKHLDISGWVLDGPNPNLSWDIWGNSFPDERVTIIADNWEVTTDDILAKPNDLHLIWDVGYSLSSANNWNLHNTKQDLSKMSNLVGTDLTQFKGWTGLGGVTSMEGMLSRQSKLEEVSIIDANMPNLTNTTGMLGYGSALTKVDLSGWSGMTTTALEGMFQGTKEGFQLTTDETEIGQAIKAEYDKIGATSNQVMEYAEEPAVPHRDGGKTVEPPKPSFPVEDTSMYYVPDPMVENKVNGDDSGIRWHDTETPVGTELYLKATIRYAGDVGAQSEDINLEVVLPTGMVPAQNPDIVVGGFQFTGENTGYQSGGVLENPKLIENEAGNMVFTAKVGSMYSGTEIEMSFKVKLEDVAPTGQYKLWDVTATTNDENSTANDALRFWESVKAEVKQYPITIETTGMGKAWTDVSQATAGTPITVYTQGGTVDSITAIDSNGTQVEVKRVAGNSGDGTDQYTFQMPEAAVTVKVVFAQSQQPPQLPGGDVPQTGDTSGIVAMVALVNLCAAGALIYMISKRKNAR